MYKESESLTTNEYKMHAVHIRKPCSIQIFARPFSYKYNNITEYKKKKKNRNSPIRTRRKIHLKPPEEYTIIFRGA